MRHTIILLGALALLVTQPLAAAEPGPLTPGKPAGVKPAQASNLLPIYGGVALLGALLAVSIGVSGSSVSSSAALADSAAGVAVSTSP
jgi:uncharacterized protein GlcG (DUF336 family)